MQCAILLPLLGRSKRSSFNVPFYSALLDPFVSNSCIVPFYSKYWALSLSNATFCWFLKTPLAGRSGRLCHWFRPTS